MNSIAASSAYLLISHGSRDPRPQEAMNRLAELVRQRLESLLWVEPANNTRAGSLREQESVRTFYPTDYLDGYLAAESHSAGRQTSLLTKPSLSASSTLDTGINPPGQQNPGVIVGTACLELASIPLSEQICEFGCRLIAAGVGELKLLPMFLMAGVHVMEDIPKEIATAKAQLGDSIRIIVSPHLGAHSDIAAVLERRLAAVPLQEAILVAHGSRRPKGNKKVQQLAKRLNTAVAYWAVPPDIETQVIELMQQGCQGLTILPYFLFAGGITDAITHRTEELAERFPKVKFRLLPTLGATEEVADLVVDLIEESESNRV